jgi:hypothetical protein
LTRRLSRAQPRRPTTRELVLEDIRNGLLSPDRAREVYAVDLDVD